MSELIARLKIEGTIGGVSIQSVLERSAPGGVSQSIALPAAEGGSLTTRTNDTSGEITMADAGHGISTGDDVDIYWSGGVAYGCTVGTVAGTAVPITDVAGGDVFPAQGTAVNVDEVTILDADFDGDNLQLIMVLFKKRGHVLFEDSGPAELHAGEALANEPWVWADTNGFQTTNPLAGNPVDAINISNGDSDDANDVLVLAILDSDA